MSGGGVDKSRYLQFSEERPCPLCGADDKHTLSKKMQFRMDCTTVICKLCGFCFVSPPPEKTAYQQYYKEAYAIHYRAIHRSVDLTRTVESPSAARRLDSIERQLPLKGSRVLEIGPGNGVFLSHLSKRGASCSAIEPSRDFRSALESAGIEIVGDFLENVPQLQPFDVICLFQVLEHFENPVEALSRISGLLGDNGLLVLDVPNLMHPYRSLDRYFLRYVHLSYFTPASLRRLLAGRGFEVLQMDAGNEQDFFSAQPLFVIARKRQIAREALGAAEITEDWRQVAARLQEYRRRYRFWLAPRLHAHRMRRALRTGLSRSFLGAGYRGFQYLVSRAS